MRLEGEHRRRTMRYRGPLPRASDDLAVAEMDPVEIADGHDRAPEPLDAGALVAHDDKWVLLRGFDHGRGAVGTAQRVAGRSRQVKEGSNWPLAAVG
jgi:hypothetical protein